VPRRSPKRILAPPFNVSCSAEVSRARFGSTLTRLRRGAISIALLGVGFGCGQTVPIGFDEPSSGGTGTLGGTGGALGLAGGDAAPVGGSAGTAGGGAAPCQPTECRGRLYQCGNCEDDDGDGALDALDSGCLGPCDDDELGLSTGLASTAGACRQDCYFDGDAGPGNDKCEWSHQCDPLSVAPSYPPTGEERCAYDPEPNGLSCAELSATQPAQCLDSCLAVVPNGCDCFGCCELPARSGEYRYIGAGRGSASCTLDALTDPEACPPCTPVDSCRNECSSCEVCVGGERDPTCEPSEPRCGTDQSECGPGAPCGIGFYCVTGCCVRSPVR
jgi:hypothetical protein